jgi:hypothetical protein
MPEARRRLRGRGAGAPIAALAAVALSLAAGLGVAAPAVAVGADRTTGGERVVQAAPPVETCLPGDTSQTGGFTVCREATGPGGGLGALLPIAGVVVVAGIAVLLGAFLVLERRTTHRLAPAEPGEWWTCRNCGRSNVVGSPRCYACGSWLG